MMSSQRAEVLGGRDEQGDALGSSDQELGVLGCYPAPEPAHCVASGKSPLFSGPQFTLCRKQQRALFCVPPSFHNRKSFKKKKGRQADPRDLSGKPVGFGLDPGLLLNLSGTPSFLESL